MSKNDIHTKKLLKLKKKIRAGKIDEDDECDPGDCGGPMEMEDIKAEANARKKVIELTDDEEIAVAEGVL
jgi:hypothetical protein